MNPEALHPTGRDKEGGGSSVPLHFEHWKRAVARGLQKGMESQGVPQRTVIPCVATEQRHISAHSRLHPTEYQQKENSMKSVRDESYRNTRCDTNIYAEILLHLTTSPAFHRDTKLSGRVSTMGPEGCGS